MRILGKKESLCIQCQACERVCSNLYFKDESPEKSAIRINREKTAERVITVCSQCGQCETICPINAIVQDRNGVYRIDKKLCVGCLACVGFCPEAAMFHLPGANEPFKCVACGACAKQCPTGAIFIADIEKGGEL
ncbi:MAG: 4Fe-4S binding protein [Negativicutes bacterium]|nr:4Fe-4S binding protein [Negativicutes bacterium]